MIRVMGVLDNMQNVSSHLFLTFLLYLAINKPSLALTLAAYPSSLS